MKNISVHLTDEEHRLLKDTKDAMNMTWREFLLGRGDE